MAELNEISAAVDARVGDVSPVGINSVPSETRSPEDSDRTSTLAGQLRSEANNYKDSFTWQAFQALSISSVTLGGIVYLMFNSSIYFGLTAPAILILALGTCRLGAHSYSSANRHYGYELFLYRIRTIPVKSYGRWRNEYADIEWEAAMRAWRVVQASLYEAVYKPAKGLLTADPYRVGFDPARRPLWFSQASLFGVTKGVKWYAGSYLDRVQFMLFRVADFALVIVAITAVAPILNEKLRLVGASPEFNYALQFVVWVILFLAFILVRARVQVEQGRRKMLEDGLLSIHSCAIVWQAVVLAHFTALTRARQCKISSWDLANLTKTAKRKWPKEWQQWQDGLISFEKIIDLAKQSIQFHITEDGAGLAGYTFWLGQEAASLARCADDVPGWVGVGEDTLHNHKSSNDGQAPKDNLAFFRQRRL